MSKQAILDIIKINKTIARHSGEKQPFYRNTISPMQDEFEKKHGLTPQLYLKSFLDSLPGIEPPFKLKPYAHWARKINSYVWATCYYQNDPDLKSPVNFSPQLYVKVTEDGCRFGFAYGTSVTNENELVSAVISNADLRAKVLACSRNIPAYAIETSEMNQRISEAKLIAADSLISNWTRNIHLIKVFDSDMIPDDIDNQIEKTLNELLPFYKDVCKISGNGLEVKQPKKELKQNNLFKETMKNFDISALKKDFLKTGLQISETLITRLTGALITKPFVILTGLSGSGKSMVAQVFASWICDNENQICMIPVGADWTNREPLLGYPNALQKDEYVKPDNGALDLMLNASKNPTKPFFLILDEMNLSHVERYFADFLSAMESVNNSIPLHSGTDDWSAEIPPKVILPKNLFIIGTVNIDETTYMFSPKVLDRANVIEFRVTSDEMKIYLDQLNSLEVKAIRSNGSSMAEGFVRLCSDTSLRPNTDKVPTKELVNFFRELKKTGAEFGYRSASEILRFTSVIGMIEPSWSMEKVMDAAIMQKLLPKVHGSRRKLEPILRTLGALCLRDGVIIEEILASKEESDFFEKTKYPMSFEKIWRMYRGLLDNGFTSYAEA